MGESGHSKYKEKNSIILYMHYTVPVWMQVQYNTVTELMH